MKIYYLFSTSEMDVLNKWFIFNAFTKGENHECARFDRGLDNW